MEDCSKETFTECTQHELNSEALEQVAGGITGRSIGKTSDGEVLHIELGHT